RSRTWRADRRARLPGVRAGGAGTGRSRAPWAGDHAVGRAGQIDVRAEGDVQQGDTAVVAVAVARGARRHAGADARARGGAVRIRDRQRRAEEAPGLAGILRIGDPGGGAVAVATGIRVGGGAEADRTGARIAARDVRERGRPVGDDRGRNADARSTEVEAAAREVQE